MKRNTHLFAAVLAIVTALLACSCNKDTTPEYPDADFTLSVVENRQDHLFTWKVGSGANGILCDEQSADLPLVVTAWNTVTVTATSSSSAFTGISLTSSDDGLVRVEPAKDSAGKESANTFTLVWAGDSPREDNAVKYDTPEYQWKEKTYTKHSYTELVTLTARAGSHTKTFKVASQEVIPLQAVEFTLGPDDHYFITEGTYSTKEQRIMWEYNRQDIYGNGQRIGAGGTARPHLTASIVDEDGPGYEMLTIQNLVPENASWRYVEQWTVYPVSPSSFEDVAEYFNLDIEPFYQTGKTYAFDFSELQGRQGAWCPSFQHMSDLHNPEGMSIFDIGFYFRTNWKGKNGPSSYSNILLCINGCGFWGE